MVRLYSIQYLRAVAATAVIVFHIGVLPLAFAEIGNAGVDIFFVISGFVMWTVATSRPQTPREFILNRVFRIVPMYWFVTLSFVGAAIMVPMLFPRLVLDLGHTVASLLFIPMLSPSNGKIWPVLVPGWSLNYEMFFYVLFALALFLPKRRWLPFLISIFLGLTLLGGVYAGSNPLIITYTDSMMLEFLAGVILGPVVEADRLPPRPWGYLLVSIGVLLFMLGALMEVTSPRVIVWGIPALLLVAGALTLEVRGSIPKLLLATLIGDASYSIYLTHTLTISALSKFRIFFSSAPYFAVCLSLSILVGIAAWRLAERPMTEYIKRKADVLRQSRNKLPSADHA